MVASDIVRDYLKSNGFGGLCKEGCGCGIEDVGFLCDGNIGECEPAYLHTKADCSTCECDCPSASDDTISDKCYRAYRAADNTEAGEQPLTQQGTQAAKEKDAASGHC